MEPWQEVFSGLRAHYVRSTSSALEPLVGLIDRLEARPQDSEALVALRRSFHNLAGSGACYGFPGIGAAGQAGEGGCAVLLRDGGGPDAGLLLSWRMLVRTIRLQLEIAAGEPDRAPAAGTGGPDGALQAGGRPGRILSMEDDPHQAAYLQAILEAAGHEVRSCQEPGRFAAELHAFAPDLVLMDLLLPGSSGPELVKALRLEERHAALPVLFLTSEDQAQARIATVEAGGDDHLIKPVAPALLLSAIETRLARSRRLNHLLSRDGLTRLLNQTALLERAAALVQRRRHEPQHRAAWAMIDLDHFKSINDRHGHPIGDQVLTAVAALLRRDLRKGDSVGRCGGEEFAVLLDELGETEALLPIDRLRQEFAALDHLGDGRVPFRATFSCGIAELKPGMDLSAWREAADKALYAAKAAGRNRVERAGAPSAPGLHKAPASRPGRRWKARFLRLLTQTPLRSLLDGHRPHLETS